MEITVKNLPNSQAEITVEIGLDEAKPYLESAAAKICKERPISGYRPGHAPYDVICRTYGDMAVHEVALQDIVVKSYAKAVKDNELVTYGEPSIDVKKLVPGEPIIYTAKIAIVPKVIEIGNLDKIKVKIEPKKIKDEDVNKAVEELCKMRTKESAVNRPVGAKDKVVVDMDMKIDNVPIEGGQARDHGIYLDEDYYVPGLRDKLVGANVNESLTFTLPFPKEHFQKTLAGKDVQFAVTIKQVFQLDPPPADDELAKSVGQDSLDKLKELIRKNMEQEAGNAARRKAEDEIVEKLMNGSKFGDVPDIMINQEVDRMIHELEHEIAHRGMDFDKYLKDAGKSLGQIKLDFAVQALKRIKTALLIKAVGDREKIEISDAEVLEEQQAMLNRYLDDGAAQDKIRSEDFMDYIRANMRNKKVLDFIVGSVLDK